MLTSRPRFDPGPAPAEGLQGTQETSRGKKGRDSAVRGDVSRPESQQRSGSEKHVLSLGHRNYTSLWRTAHG